MNTQVNMKLSGWKNDASLRKPEQKCEKIYFYQVGVKTTSVMLVSNAGGLTLTVPARSPCVRTGSTQLEQWQPLLVLSARLCMHNRSPWLPFPSSKLSTSEEFNWLGCVYFSKSFFYPERVSRSQKRALWTSGGLCDSVSVCVCVLFKWFKFLFLGILFRIARDLSLKLKKNPFPWPSVKK